MHIENDVRIIAELWGDSEHHAFAIDILQDFMLRRRRIDHGKEPLASCFRLF